MDISKSFLINKNNDTDDLSILYPRYLLGNKTDVNSIFDDLYKDIDSPFESLKDIEKYVVEKIKKDYRNKISKFDKYEIIILYDLKINLEKLFEKFQKTKEKYEKIEKEYKDKKNQFNENKIIEEYNICKLKFEEIRTELVFNFARFYYLHIIKNNFEKYVQRKNLKNFIKFAKEYYKEIELAKNGIILNDKLSVCTCKTPHKTNMILQDLNALLGYEFFKDRNSVEDFKDHIKKQKIEKDLVEINKIYQSNSNSFWYKVEKTLSKEKILLSNDEFDKIQKNDEIFQKIIKYFELANELYIKLQTYEIYGKFNFILQIFNILLKPRSGFANYCKEHSKEVMFRLKDRKSVV